MPDVVDKVVVGNLSALEKKYGAAGRTAVVAAVARMVKADKKWGLATRPIWIDVAADMKAVKGTAVKRASSAREAKAAVDAIAKALSPDYILLLDGPDVIPHVPLDNDMAGGVDTDAEVASDLPYASDAKFGRKVADFLAVTRVVGRIPAASGETDPAVLVGLIDAALVRNPRPRADYAEHFAVSAKVWSESTALSLEAVFGNDRALMPSPVAKHPAIDKRLARLTHFINCHGASGFPEFYGQRGETIAPVAMRSAKVGAKVKQGTVVAAECCYGAELYDYSSLGTEEPICMAYLRAGAVGFVGSTTIAYGPEDSNGQADLICQYFLQAVLAGASLGRAFLQARQDFVRRQKMASPANLKTLGQFILLGDPSSVPVAAPTLVKKGAPGAMAGIWMPKGKADMASQRKNRRDALRANGEAFASASTHPARRTDPGAAAKSIRRIANERGFGRKSPLSMFTVSGGAAFKAAAGGAKAAGEGARRVAILCEARQPRGRVPPGTSSIHVLVTHMLGNGIVAVEECESRGWTTPGSRSAGRSSRKT